VFDPTGPVYVNGSTPSTLLDDILELLRPPAWHADAACKGMVDLFYPEGAGDPASRAITEARAVCAGCPVREPCLEAGMGERHGVWGGAITIERRQLRKARRPAA
jgi:WhiB family redox-sensing transcriptional regulator